MVNIEINGQTIEAPEGSMLIEAADAAGITIPRFCYHSKLSLAASCRMCLVEVEKAPKPMPACATPVSDGMKVHTRSPKAIASQRAVMEFLLINHPLDCPICDQGGECDLQEIAVGYGQDASQYIEKKRIVKDKEIGPVISTDLTRCIQCTRCVRFGTEIAGLMELGAPGRGEHMHIGTFVEKGVTSELSGNLADICPVGSLTLKPYRYKGRPWELTPYSTISLHDSVGSNMRVDVRRGEVLRVVPQANEAINETWLADRDRFTYQSVTHKDRIKRPRIKTNGQWHDVDWDRALTVAAAGLKKILNDYGAEKLGALCGSIATAEEYYLLQKLIRGMGSDNIDHRLRQSDFSDQATAPLYPWLGQAISDLESVNAALVVGSNTRLDQPLIASRLRKASRAGAAVSFINPAQFDQRINGSKTVAVSPSMLVEAVAAVAKAAAQKSGKTIPDQLKSVVEQANAETRHEAIAQQLIDAKASTVLVGNLASYHPQKSALWQLSALVAELTGSKLGFIADGGNSVAAHLAGAVPHREAGAKSIEKSGLNWSAMTKGGLKGYLLMGLESQTDSAAPKQLIEALKSAEFTVVMNSFDSAEINEYADVVLPIATYFETAGSSVNNEGVWQRFDGVLAPVGDARPAWKVLRVMGNLVDLAGFEFMSIDEVTSELKQSCEGVVAENQIAWSSITSSTVSSGLQRIVDFPAYSADAMTRRSQTLQQIAEMQGTNAARVNRSTAEKAGVEAMAQVVVSHNGVDATVNLMIDDAIPDDCIYLPVTPVVADFGADVAGFELRSAETE